MSMNTTTADKNRVDDNRVAEIRRLLAEGGEKAVSHRFGEGEANSKEFRAAQQQLQAQKQRQVERRKQLTSANAAKARAGSKGRGSDSRDRASAAPKNGASTAPERTKGKPSERERMLAARKDEAQHEPQSRSR